ncbi:MAG: YbjN domain-containing protein [Chloroflexi bacterium]|nr:YbjN domain-containing protein [Chloroflexota bacterium]
MQLTPEKIEEYFQRYSWSYTRSSENTWITGVRTSVSSFRIFIRLSEHWVYFVINPFVVAPPNPEDRLRVYYHILRLNLDMNMAKFGLDSDSDVFLAVELPTENFEYSHFADALNGLSHHAERLYSEVFNLSHNSAVVTGRYDEELYNFSRDEHRDDNTVNSMPGDSQRSRMPEQPLDDFDLPSGFNSDSDEDHGPIIAGKEVRIVDDEDGSFRIEFETAHDLEDDDESGEDGGEKDDTPLLLSDRYGKGRKGGSKSPDEPSGQQDSDPDQPTKKHNSDADNEEHDDED